MDGGGSGGGSGDDVRQFVDNHVDVICVDSDMPTVVVVVMVVVLCVFIVI